MLQLGRAEVEAHGDVSSEQGAAEGRRVEEMAALLDVVALEHLVRGKGWR